MTRSTRTAAVLAALLLGLASIGCGSSKSDSSTSAGLGPESPYFQKLAAAAAPLKGKSIPSLMDRTASAAEYRRTATELEGFLAETRAYLRRLEAIEPPPGCDLVQRRMERAWRASIPVYEGAIPLYRRAEREGIVRYLLRAHRLLRPLTAPLAAPDGSEHLPCA